MITSNRIGKTLSKNGTVFVQSCNPVTQKTLPEKFPVATTTELNQATDKAHLAWRSYKNTSPKVRAQFLRTIAQEIENDPEIVKRAVLESGLPEGRIVGERGRTMGQLNLFATLVENGSWVHATVETAIPDRTPLPKEDLRMMLQAVGPVAVFGASNFPLAFSTAGGDTASALASGCPVIVKAHNAHLGTNALVSDAVLRAAEKCDLPDGVFSSLQGVGNAVGKELVSHPKIKAVAFTGSLKGGMALYHLASQRPEPIPVFAEMGSVNPVFILPEVIASKGEALAHQLAGSVNLGSGQFCTGPGLLVLQKDDHTEAFVAQLTAAFEALSPTTMLTEGIWKHYEQTAEKLLEQAGVSVCHRQPSDTNWNGCPILASVSATTFLKNNALQEEVFGPLSLLILCENMEEMDAVTEALHGQLTGTIIGTEGELPRYKNLYERLQERVGRVIFNGVPTGVEVCHAMQHGGPFPASTDSRFTSVGTGAIKRFVRPVSFQNCPDALLPSALKRGNPDRLDRCVNGAWSQDPS